MSEEIDGDTEDIAIEIPESVKELDRTELEKLATLQGKALTQMFENIAQPTVNNNTTAVGDSLPTANYFKLSTMKFQMEFNSSDASLDSLVDNALKVVAQVSSDKTLRDMASAKDPSKPSSAEYL